MSCFQDQLKRFPWTPERVASLWKAAKENYIDKGATFEDTVHGLSADTGLKREIIVQGLTKPKGAGRVATEEMWLKQRARRIVEQQARTMVAEMNRGSFSRLAEDIANIPRKVATVGHFTVFPKTHLSDLLFTDPKVYLRTFKDSMNLSTRGGIIAHEQRILRMKVDPDYNAAVRAGLDVEIGGGFSKFRGATKEVLGSAKESRSAMAFDELRFARFDVFKKALKLLGEDERNNDNLKAIAEVVNNKTGAATIRSSLGKLLTKFLFAPRLLPAQFRSTFVDPVRAIKTFAHRASATPGELVAARFVTRRMATLASVYTATLAAEAAYSSLTGDKKNQPNLTNINRSDWLRLKLFGYGVPMSPTVEFLKLPIQMVYAMANARPGENRFIQGGKKALSFIVGRQNPLYAGIEEALTGQNPGSGRPTPFPGLLGSAKETLSKPRETYTEFLGEKMPIPVAGLVRELYDEMREQGLSHPDAKTWIQSLVSSTVSGVTGYHFASTHESPYDKAEAGINHDIFDQLTSDQQKKMLGRAVRQETKKAKLENAQKPEPGLW